MRLWRRIKKLREERGKLHPCVNEDLAKVGVSRRPSVLRKVIIIYLAIVAHSFNRTEVIQ